MKMGKKSVLCIMFLLCAALITGCGEKGPVETTTLNFEGYPIETDQEITYWMELNANISSIYENMGETPFAHELEKGTGVKVKYIHPVTGQEEQSLSLLIASDELPDIVEYDWTNYQGGPNKSIRDEIIISLNDQIEKNAPNLSKILEENKDIDRMVKTDDGMYYVFPFIREDETLLKSTGPIIRRDWLNELNLEMPKTISELETVLTAFKQKGADVPFSFKSWDINEALTLFGAAPSFYVDNGVVKFGPLEDNYKVASETLHRWFSNGLLDNNFVSTDAKVLDSNVLNGRTGLTIGGGGGDLGRWLDVMAEEDESFDMVGLVYPAKEIGAPVEFYNVMQVYPGNNSCAISANCKSPDLAARFLDYAYSDEGYLLYNFGIENKSYEMKDGAPTYTDEIFHNPDGLTMSQAMVKYFRSSWSGPFIQSKEYLAQYYHRPQQQESLGAWLKNYDAVAEKQYPITTLTTEESEEYTRIMLEAEKFVNETRTSFILGTKSLTEYENYMTTLRSLNIDRAIEIRQNALDRFNKR